MPIDDKQLDEWQQLWEKNKPGTWVPSHSYPGVGNSGIMAVPESASEFVLACRTAIPLLIQEVRRLQAFEALAIALRKQLIWKQQNEDAVFIETKKLREKFEKEVYE